MRRLFAVLVLLFCPIVVWKQYDFVQLALLEHHNQAIQQQPQMLADFVASSATDDTQHTDGNYSTSPQLPRSTIIQHKIRM
jgi:hypothetical protein